MVYMRDMYGCQVVYIRCMYRVLSGLYEGYANGAKWFRYGVCTGCEVVYLRCMYRV